MSPQNKRRGRSLYLLMAMNLVLLFLSGYAIHSFRSLEQRSYQACLRGNVTREVARFAMGKLGSPERARLPELQEQDCAAIYPGGAR